MNFYFVLLLVSVAFAHEEERHGDHCRCEKGCGPGFEKSYLGYHGQFKGGARKHVPVYEKRVSYEKDCVVKGGRGYYPHHHEHEHHHDCPYREKRHAPCERCHCEKGCGPGFERSFLGYHGKFKGGAAKHVPVYEKQVSYEKDCVVKGGRGYYPHHHEHEPERDCPYREKRHAPCERCHCEKGCGPGFEKSYLGYHGQFKGGARKHVPVYEKRVSYEKDCVVKGGHGYYHHEREPERDCPYREKRHAPCERCHCEKGCGPGFERSYLGYHGQFKGGASRHVPVYEKQVSYEKDCIVKGGRGGYCGHPQKEGVKYEKYEE